MARQLRQEAMAFAKHWPLETRAGWNRFTQVCASAGVKIVMYEGKLWFDKI